MSDYFKQIDYDQEAKSARQRSIIFLALAVITPIMSLTGLLKPKGEDMAVWFQRCGALVVFLASFSELYALKILATFSPISSSIEPKFSTKFKHCTRARPLILISGVTIGIGTLIWGYGDLIYNLIESWVE